MRNTKRSVLILLGLLVGLSFGRVPFGHAASKDSKSYQEIDGKTYAIDIDTARWAFIARAGLDSLFYYDTKSIVHDQGMVRVWTISFYPKGSTATNTNTSKILYEIDCRKRLERDLEFVVDDWDGNHMQFRGNGKWGNIPPETVFELLLDKVCVPRSD